MIEPTHEEMLEEAAKREAANEVIIAKVSEEDYQKVQKEVANKKAWEAVEKLYAENGDALKELADIEKEERMDAVRAAIAGIDKYSDALKELRKIEHEELMEELQAKKKENFQLVADACMKEYEQKYHRDVFPVDEHWVYMVS
jgi:rRNA maturation endonuclease Nob1